MGANCPSFSCCCILRHIFFVYGTNCPDFNMITGQREKCGLGVRGQQDHLIGTFNCFFLNMSPFWTTKLLSEPALSPLHWSDSQNCLIPYLSWKSGSFPLMLHFGSFPPSLPRSRVASQSVFLGGWQEIPHLTQTCSFDTFNLEDRQLIWNFFKGKKPMSLDFLASILSIVSFISDLIEKWSDIGYLKKSLHQPPCSQLYPFAPRRDEDLPPAHPSAVVSNLKGGTILSQRLGFKLASKIETVVSRH